MASPSWHGSTCTRSDVLPWLLEEPTMNFEILDARGQDVQGAVRRMATIPMALSLVIHAFLPSSGQAQDRQDRSEFLANRHALREARQLTIQSARQERLQQRLDLHTERQLSIVDRTAMLNSRTEPMRTVRFDLQNRRDVFSLTQDDFGGSSSVQLMLGNTRHEFHVGDDVSAAEYAAIRGGASSSLTLDEKGRATGGTFSFNSLTSTLSQANISKVIIPEGVTAFGDFSANADLQLGGDLVNRGTVIGFSTNSANQTGSLSANNIINRSGATISTGAGSPTNSIANFSLILNATKDIVNSGSITSGGNLTLNAGNSIVNALTDNQPGPAPLIQAANAVRMVSGNGSFINAGTISSVNDSITLSALLPTTAIDINASGGLFDAKNGSINVRSQSDTSAGDVTIFGGDFLSSKLNIYADHGEIFGNVGQVTGHLNTSAVIEHFFVATETLLLGDNCVTGDPVFANRTGSIVVDGKNDFTEALAIIANGDITGTNNAQINNPGHSVILIAGAKANTGNSIGIKGKPIDKDVTVSLDPALSNGGSILFSDSAASQVINTSSSTGNGGNVILAAVGKGTTGGLILMGTDHGINTTSSAPGKNGGSVSIIAGANPTTESTTISVGDINTGGAANGGKGGAISLLTQQPFSSAAKNEVTFNPQGAITNGDIKGNGVTSAKAGISAKDIITTGAAGVQTSKGGSSAGAITITAGSSINGTNVLAYGTGGYGGVTSSTSGGDAGNGAAINISSLTGDIILGAVNSSGGGGGGASGNNGTQGKGGKGGTGAGIDISTAGVIALSGPVYAADGGAGGDGSPGGASGGGGGSYGGGGGGSMSSGGGGGYFGGGGGGDSVVVSGSGGGLSGGAGGAGVILSGQNGKTDRGGDGGNGFKGDYAGAGGALGAGGQGNGGDSYPTPGKNGVTVTTGKTVNITAGKSLTVGRVVGDKVKLTTSGSSLADITITDTVRGFTSVDLKTSKGNLVFDPLAKVIQAPLLTFTSDSGSFGTNSQRVLTAVPNIQINTGGSSVFITNTGSLTFAKAQAANSTFDVKVTGGDLVTAKDVLIASKTLNLNATGGSINVQMQGGNLIANATKNVDIVSRNGVVITGDSSAGDTKSANTFNLATTTLNQFSSGFIDLQANISAGFGSIILSSTGVAGTQGGIGGSKNAVLSAQRVTITGTTAGDIGSAAQPLRLLTPLQSSEITFTVNAKGEVFISQEGSIKVQDSSADSTVKAGKFQLLVTPDSLSRGRVIFDGGVKVTGVASKGPSSLFIQSSEKTGGPGGMVWNGGAGDALVAGDIVLIDGVGGAGTQSIGTAAKPIITQSTNSLSVSTVDSAFINNTGNTTLLDSKFSAISTFVLNNVGDLNKGGSGGTITAQNVIIKATGDAGTVTNPIGLDAQNLSLQAGGSVFATNSSATTVNLLVQSSNAVAYSNKAGNTFSLNVTGDGLLTNSAVLTAKSVDLTATTIATAAALTATEKISLTATKNGVSVGQSTTAPAIVLSALGDLQTIVQAPTGLLDTKQLTIVLSNGVANLQNVENKVSGLTDNVSGNGQVLLKTVSEIVLGNLVGATQQLNIQYTGKLSTTAKSDFTTGLLTFVPTGKVANNSIVIANNLNGSTLTTMTTSGSGTLSILAGGSLVGIGDKVLTTDAGNMSFAGALSGNQVTLTTSGGSITQTAAGVITSNNGLGDLIINLKKGGTAGLSVANNAFTTFRDTVANNGIVQLKTSGDLVLLQVDGATQTLSATAAKNIITPNVVQAQKLVLVAGGSGGIASSGARLQTTATDISVKATADNANVFVTTSSTNNVALRDSQGGGASGGTLDLIAAGAVTLEGTITGGQISVLAGGAGGITITGKVGDANTNSVSLSTTGAGDITSSGTQVRGNTVNFASQGGSIKGARAGLSLLLVTSNLTVATIGNGIVDLDNEGKTPLVLNNSSSGQRFDLVTTGDLIVSNVQTNAGIATKNGSIELISEQGNIVINNNSNITANGGNIEISAQASTANINVGAGSTILASSTVAGVGNVTLNTGAASFNQPGPTPANVNVNETKGGKVYFGTKGITANAPNNTLNAEGRNISFSGDKVGSIVLGGGVTITADPPAGSLPSGTIFDTVARADSRRLASVAGVTEGTDFDLSMVSLLSDNRTIDTLANSNAQFANLDVVTENISSVSASNNSRLISSLSTASQPLLSSVTAVDQLGSNTLNFYACQSSSGVENRSLVGVIEAEIVSDQVVKPTAVMVASETSKSDQENVLTVGVAKNRMAHRTSTDVTFYKQLFDGNALYTPLASTAVIDTKFGELTIAPRSLVLAMATPSGLAVFNFDDQHRGAVTLKHGDKHISVAPGQHLLIVDQADANFSEVNVHEHVFYSNVQSSVLGNGRQMFNAEFFIPSAIESVRPLKELMVSRNADSVSKSKRLLKTIAVLMQLKGGVSNYQQYQRRRETAWR